MDEKSLIRFRSVLATHYDAISNWLNTDYEKDVHLGNASINDVLQHVTELKDVLERIDDGKFGVCENCGGEVEEECLEFDYSARVCLEHFSKEQIRALEKDLELAVKVQKQLLPCCVPSLPKIQLTFHSDSAQFVGGDYFDFFISQDGEQGIAIADVMGKGLPASMLMSNLQASLRILGPEYRNLHELAARLNGLFLNNLKLIKFISLFLAKINLETNQLQYCNAGHHPPLWWQAASKSFMWLNPTGPAIGLTNNGDFGNAEIRLGPSDLVVFYTDGLVEARNSNLEEFGEKRLEALIRKNHHEAADTILENLVTSVNAFTSSFHDDVTVIVLKIIQ